MSFCDSAAIHAMMGAEQRARENDQRLVVLTGSAQVRRRCRGYHHCPRPRATSTRHGELPGWRLRSQTRQHLVAIGGEELVLGRPYLVDVELIEARVGIGADSR